MNAMPFNIKCCGCGYVAGFEQRSIAETAALMHIILGGRHVVTCTQPRASVSGRARLVFIANSEHKPPIATLGASAPLTLADAHAAALRKLVDAQEGDASPEIEQARKLLAEYERSNKS